jgi:hypothetical protein
MYTPALNGSVGEKLCAGAFLGVFNLVKVTLLHHADDV